MALLPWGDLVEDFLATAGISLDEFCSSFMGSWTFGYVKALEQSGIRVVVVVVSAAVLRPQRRVHGPTGAAIWVLPASRAYRLVRRVLPNPYARTVRQAGDLRGPGRLVAPLLWPLHQVALYLSTPLSPLARVLRSERCDVILCQEYEYPRFDLCVLLGGLLGVPVYATFQGGDYQRIRLERSIRPRTLRRGAGLVIASGREIERVRARYQIRAENIRQIPNPVDLSEWTRSDRTGIRTELGIAPEARVAVWHGRVSIEQKGLDLLLDAWRRVCREWGDSETLLLLVGSGRDAERLHRKLRDVPAVLWIDRFLHDRQEVGRYLAAGDVYVFPSRHEGFAVAPLEAMASGLPVVAFDASGVADLFPRGERSGGIIVPAGDSGALADALGRLLHDPELGRKLGRQGRCRVEEAFASEEVGKQLRQFFFPD